MSPASLSSSTALYKLCLIAFLGTICFGHQASTGAGAETPTPFTAKELSYYVHLEFGGQDLAFAFLPPVNTTFTDNFGSGNLFALNMTKEESRTSQLLGFVRGFTIETSYVRAASRSLEVAAIEYSDGVYTGTIQLQGIVVSSGTEVAIVGGTGSFRGARGYLLVSFISAVEPNQLYRHQLFFM